jgi:hypothetical protein
MHRASLDATCLWQATYEVSRAHRVNKETTEC